MSASTKRSDPSTAQQRADRVSIWRVIPWSTHSFSANALIVLTGYFTIYATDTLALNPAIVGGLLVGAKVIDAIGALLCGWIIDRAPMTRFGKARPFDLVIIACWATTAFMFATPGDLDEFAKYLWIFSSYLLLTALFMPLYNANSVLYTARVFPRREQYGDVAAKSGLVTVVAAIFITVGLPMAVSAAGKDPASWAVLGICVAVPFTLIGLVRFWMFQESPDAAAVESDRLRLRDILLVLRTNPYIWVLSAMSLLVGIYSANIALSYYFRYVVGDLALQGIVAVSFVALIPIMLAFPALIRRFSVSRMIAISSFVGAIGFLVMFFADGNIAIVMASSVLTALAALPVSFLAPILIIDNSTYNEWRGNRRLESVGGALNSFASTMGQAIASGISGAVLALSGYDGTASAQNESATLAIISLNSWVPAIFAVLVGLVALRYHRLEVRIKQISAEVLARRAGDSAPVPEGGAPLTGTESVRVVRAERNAPYTDK